MGVVVYKWNVEPVINLAPQRRRANEFHRNKNSISIKMSKKKVFILGTPSETKLFFIWTQILGF